jgi:hypothetical protein
MRECAAFASKRARKKAIEECVQVAQDCVDACGKRRKDWSIPMSFTLEQLEKLKS